MNPRIPERCPGFALISCGLLLSFPVTAVAQTITDGDSTFTMPAGSTTGATVRTGTTGGSASVMIAGGSTADHLFQQWWWYRVNGVNPREFAFSNRTSNVASGNLLTLGYTEPEGFNAVLTYRLTDGPNSPATCNIANTLRIDNTSGSSLSIAVFSYLDYDLTGSTSNSATLTAPGRMRITHTSGAFGEYLGEGAAAYQVAAFATVRSNLTDADIDDFASTGLPFGPGDWTGAFQWNLTIPAGGSVTVRSAFSINQVAVADPACLGDLDGDGDRDLSDLTRFLAAFGLNANGDLDGDGDTDLSDLTLFLSLFGIPC